MKFCYCDESGTGSEKVASMVGIIVDSLTMLRHKDMCSAVINAIRNELGHAKIELKGAKLYGGKGAWGKVPPDRRYEIISDIIQLVYDKHLRVVFSAVDKRRFRTTQQSVSTPQELNSVWRLMGLHVTLALQKCRQRESRPRGQTVIVFDNCDMERNSFGDLLTKQLPWIDEYYSRRKFQARFDRIVDVPYFANSADVPLIQFADIFAFILRRYAEIFDGHLVVREPSERRRFECWANQIIARSIGKRNIFPSQSGSTLGRIIFDCTPPSIRNLKGHDLTLEYRHT